MHRLRVAISFCSGDGTSTVVWVRRAILPNAVCIPVANTSACRFARRHRRARQQDVPAPQQVVSRPGAASRETGRASPVTVALFTRTPKAFDQPAVRGHVVAGAQEDHVAGHDVLGRDHDHRASRSALTWCGSSRCSAAIVSSARYSCQNENAPLIEDHGDDGQPRASPSPGRASAHRQNQRQEGRHPQEAGEEVGELGDEAQEERCRRQSLDPVGAELEPSRRGVGCDKPAGALRSAANAASTGS